jgi:hypothetical protein
MFFCGRTAVKLKVPLERAGSFEYSLGTAVDHSISSRGTRACRIGRAAHERAPLRPAVLLQCAAARFTTRRAAPARPSRLAEDRKAAPEQGGHRSRSRRGGRRLAKGEEHGATRHRHPPRRDANPPHATPYICVLLFSLAVGVGFRSNSATGVWGPRLCRRVIVEMSG